MTKLEEIARAIHEVIAGDCSSMDIARAAVEAMRDTTKAQYDAAIMAFQDPKNRHGAVLDEVWRAMIDAILTEKPEVR